MSNFFYRNLKKPYPTIASAQGSWVEDSQGTKYLDGCSGAIVSNLGHGLKDVNEAINAQLSKAAFAHTSQFVSEAGLELARRLCALTGGSFLADSGFNARAYFTSGGSESIETALKMARGYFVESGQHKKRLVIARRPSYHGSTLGALSVTGHLARRQPYAALLPKEGEGLFAAHVSSPYSYRCLCASEKACASSGCARAYADLIEEAIESAGSENVMAVIGEPIIGAALGAAVPGNEYWPRVREICTKHGVLLIADEVMTGLGRVGANFGLDLWQVEADIIALGKGLSAGYLPLGAVLASAKVVSAFEQNSGVFEHGFTYSGHPTACAAGVAVLEYMSEHDLVKKVAVRESEFFERLDALRKFDIVGDVRGRGFLAGLELVKNKTSKEPFSADVRIGQLIAQQARERGLLVYPGAGFIDGSLGEHIMIAPPFTISDAEMDTLFTRLEEALQLVCSQVFVR